MSDEETTPTRRRAAPEKETEPEQVKTPTRRRRTSTEEAEAAVSAEPQVEVAEAAKPGPRRRRAQAADEPAETQAGEQAPEKPAPKPKPKPRERSADPLQVPLYKPSGKSGGDIKLPATIFGVEPHAAVMHQALVRQLANGRQGTASTKTRGEVSGGGAKPYRQKGTGRARHGSDREPSMVGGGTVFGPQPRSYAQRMPRKMRRLALRSALSVKVREGKVSVLEGFDFEEPKTSQMIDLLHDIGVDDTALLVLPAPNLMVTRSAGNIPWAKVIIAHNLNLYDILGHDQLVVTRDALQLIEETFAPAAGAGAAP